MYLDINVNFYAVDSGMFVGRNGGSYAVDVNIYIDTSMHR